MSLEMTQVHRNLRTKVTFLGLEFEDLILVLALAAVLSASGVIMKEHRFPRLVTDACNQDCSIQMSISDWPCVRGLVERCGIDNPGGCPDQMDSRVDSMLRMSSKRKEIIA